jgi:hypothetical protein
MQQQLYRSAPAAHGCGGQAPATRDHARQQCLQRGPRRRLQLACGAAQAGASAVRQPGAESVLHLERSLEAGVSGSAPPREAAAAERTAEPASVSGSKRTLANTEIFHSTWQHRAWVGSAVAVLSATFLRGCAKVHDPVAASVAAAAVVAAYYAAGARTLPQPPLPLTGAKSACARLARLAFAEPAAQPCWSVVAAPGRPSAPDRAGCMPQTF